MVFLNHIKKTTVVALVSLGVCASVCAAQRETNVGLMPGDRADAHYKPSETKKGHEPPESWRFPYVATYYLEPTVTPADEVKVRFYVSDWDQSEVRFADDSQRFGVVGLLERVGAKPNEKPRKVALSDIGAGDHEIAFGKLAIGDWRVCVCAKDSAGRESHRVWHEFRVARGTTPSRPENKGTTPSPPENKGATPRGTTPSRPENMGKQIYTMTEKDLAKYGIRNDDHRERLVAEGKTAPKPDPKQPGYLVTYAAKPDGTPIVGAFKTRRIAYDAGYDKVQVEAEALANVKGLNKLMEEKAASGVKRLVLLPGTYRLSAKGFVSLPDNFTLDLNGAVLKENGFTGDHSNLVKFESAIDAHLVNGTLEGDYWEHDYEHSPNNSEWPMGFSIGGDSRYSSVEKVTVRYITGYGGGNGIDNDRRGRHCYYMRGVKFTEVGGIDRATGKVDANAKGFVTSDFVKLPEDQPFVQVAKYLGYQGFAYGGWWMTVAFYSEAHRLISAETGFQYRQMRIPPKAEYLRVTVESPSLEEANKVEFYAYRMRMPTNCRVVGCTFDRCRCVGYAASAMKNMLFRGNTFVRSGEASAMCAFDAEDGWDLMQDVWLDGNVFKQNPMQNDIVGCGGHNFELSNNTGYIYFWDRCYSPCAHGNRGPKATFRCASRRRSGYGRFAPDNVFDYGLTAGHAEEAYIDWDFGIRGHVEKAGAKKPGRDIGKFGRISEGLFEGVDIKYAHLSASTTKRCTITFPPYGGEWNACKVLGGEVRTSGGTVAFTGCKIGKVTFRDLKEGKTVFRNCDFVGCRFIDCDPATLVFENCTFKQTVQP